MRRHLSNDRIYRIIGGMTCIPIGNGSYKCLSRDALRKARTTLEDTKQGAGSND